MQNNKFVRGSANRPAKDAREKTSGLVDIGLLTSDRILTPAGLKLLQISRDKNFAKDNELKIANDMLIKLLEMFESRKQDVEINNYVTDNADIPTIFEYVVGIILYKISEQKGNILEYMNLSLDADLLPKSHASGGMADIEYHYNETAPCCFN